jgi:hypothetical protein
MSSARICYQYQTHGHCTYGSRCKQPHIDRPGMSIEDLETLFGALSTTDKQQVGIFFRQLP